MQSEMEGQQCDQLVTLLVKTIQAYCSGHVEFSSCVEVIGHVHLNIDRSIRVDCVLSEEVSKAVSDSSPLFLSHSYLSQPPVPESDISTINRERHTPGSHSSHQTLQPHSSNLGCVNPVSSQRLLSDGSHSFTVGTTGSGEAQKAAEQMKVTVSFDCSSIPPIVKQEINVPAESLLPESDRQALEGNHQPEGSILMNSKQATSPSVPQINIQPAVSYSQEKIQSAAAYTQEQGQLTIDYAQNSQPVAATTQDMSQSPMLQIQDVYSCSEAVQSCATCPQQNAHTQPPSSVNHSKKRYPTEPQMNSLPPTMLSKNSAHPGFANLPKNGPSHFTDQNMEDRSMNSQCPEDASSSNDFLMGCQTNARSNGQFGNLCLDVVAVKEEVMDEIPMSQDGAYALESGQERELEDFSNMMIGALGHPVEGTQLIVVTEGMQQQQQLPFPVMLHTHTGLSPSVSPGSIDACNVPVSEAGLGATCSSTYDFPVSESATDANKEESTHSSGTTEYNRRKGFQPGNQCWKLWKTAPKTKKRLHEETPAVTTVSSNNKVYKTLSSTRTIEVNHSPVTARTVPSGSTKATNKAINKKCSQSQTGFSPKAAFADAKKRKRKERCEQSQGIGSSTPTPKGPTHILKKVPWTVQKKQPRKNCVVCKEKGMYPLSCYFCPRCPKQPGYCRIRSCFISYHSQMGLKYDVPSEETK
ncbi:uncharacterized protein LOC143302275 [Babylonia areolata]|uniref:uncharacterized protein LOC143302275 n=1 Tax=Babylonia areolata TaxID=304850 RepID=UPI003FD37081